MNKLLISIKDSKADSWTTPVCADTKASAMRDFSTLVNDDRTLIGKHPADFDLFIVGSFDLLTGHVDGCVPVHLANGIDLKPQE